MYAARAEWEGGAAPAVVNVGIRPTFAESTLVIEAHLLDVSVDLYDRRPGPIFLARIRDEMSSPRWTRCAPGSGEDVTVARRVLHTRA